MTTIATTAERTGSMRALAGALLIAVAGLLALIGFTSPASAASNYPPAPSCSVAGTSTGSGSTVTGTGFQPNSPVSVSLGGSHTTVTSNSAGSFVTSLGTASGQLLATGAGCTAHGNVAALSDRTSNTVPASSQSGALPNTGADVLGVAALAGVLLIGGVFLLVQGRRRHS
ncbi:MAG TPA: LPXTG cell wall anchor domain-containing protein [Jatrophihabitans sp.]|nr:LPXTG cell wall anchor domain-containing protein [Jatrophihabitans sp.]